MDGERVEALVYPVKSLPAPPIGMSDDGLRDNDISAVTGLPAIVLPAGITAAGLPIAIESLGDHSRNQGLIEIAHAYEQSRGAGSHQKRRPRYRETFSLSEYPAFRMSNE